MNINPSLGFLLRDVYVYDIESCHYTILNSLGYDVSAIPEDKFERNKFIGLMMKDNPRLIQILRQITSATLDEYILRNRIKDDEIVLRQYDGIITTRRLVETTTKYIPLPLRKTYEYFLSSIDRHSYLAYDGNKATIKGVAHRYDEIDLMLKKLIRCNFSDRVATFKALQRIKDEIVFSKNSNLFCIPAGNKNYLFLKAYGQIEVSPSFARVMDVNDIDRQKYFDYYLMPFTKAIVFEMTK